MIERRDHSRQPESPAAIEPHSANPLAALTSPSLDLLSQVMQGDCYQLLPTLPAGSVDCIFVDPPYNIGVDYGCGNQADRLPAAEYLWQMEKLIGLCVERLTPTGSLWFLCPERWADQIGILLASHLPRRNRIIWRETFGQYRDTAFLSGHRHLFYHVMSPGRSPFITDDIRVPSQRMLTGDKRAAGPRVPDDVWEIPRLVGSAAERIPEHPCQLPETLLERVVLCSTHPGDLVLDPMAGTGTTLRVAQQLGRRYLGIEKEARFVELIEKRLAKERQGDLFLH
jgi:site-specific DNA-methyltransferase (adenine-specific)